jgi:histidinol-phosphate aminotransferase
VIIRPPEYVSALKAYVPGKPIEELERELGIKDSVKLASNENPLGPSKRALDAAQKHLSGVNRYPDGGAYYLAGALSSKLGVNENELIFGNGSNELIDMAVRTFLVPGSEAVMAWPSFVIYPMSIQAHGCHGIRVPLLDFRHDLRNMSAAITKRTKVVFIANPNNPTGTINRREEFDRFMEEVPHNVLVVVDEAYFEYVTDPEYADSMKHLREGRNMIILRTFSKIYGLAGLRIGYAITKPEIAAEMDKVRNPFNTSTIAQAAAIAALEDEEHVENSRRVNLEGKVYLYSELDALGIRYVPTEANFIFMWPGLPSAQVYDSLLRKGVIVRPAGEDTIRVTIGLPEENRKFIEGMKALASA